MIKERIFFWPSGLLLLLLSYDAAALTCYNGMKLMRGQSVGQQTEECAPGASCYNMSSSAAFVVDVVKAGCSTWRCMVSKDRCIGININFVPVELCCCSHDRCNVQGNPQYNSGGMGVGGSNYGGGGYGGGGYGGGGDGGGGGYGAPGYSGVKSGGDTGGYGGNGGGVKDTNNNQGGYGGGGYGGGGYGGSTGSGGAGGGYGGSGGGYGGGGYGGGYGGGGAGPATGAKDAASDVGGKIEIGGSLAGNPSKGKGSHGGKPQFSQKDFENAFKNFDVDAKPNGPPGAGGGQVDEEVFQMVDVTKTTRRPPRSAGPDQPHS